jgi:DnaJ-class molecular chaperone
MIDLTTLTLYEVLDIEPRATVADIKRAYKIALKTYGTDHMATYGLFTDQQKERILEKIHEAYTILIDPERRRRYDEELRRRGIYNASSVQARRSSVEGKEGREVAQEVLDETEAPLIEDPESIRRKEVRIQEILREAQEKGDWSASILRKIRETQGLTLQEIAHRTKISRGHLRALEEDSYEFLPPDTYLKGFLIQILKVMAVDPGEIAHKILEHIRGVRGIR